MIEQALTRLRRGKFGLIHEDKIIARRTEAEGIYRRENKEVSNPLAHLYGANKPSPTPPTNYCMSKGYSVTIL